jgi:hypothetical protein
VTVGRLAGVIDRNRARRPLWQGQLGMLEASGLALPVWEDVLPNEPDEELRAAAERIAAAM